MARPPQRSKRVGHLGRTLLESSDDVADSEIGSIFAAGLEPERLEEDRVMAAVRGRLFRRRAPEELVGSRYRVEGVLGRGGMGTVFEAFDTELKRRVAIKVLRSDRGFDPGWLVAEARALATLRHPNVVEVFDVGMTGPGPDAKVFVVMELVRGQTAEQWLGEGTRSRPERAEVARQLCRGLSAVHEAGLVHGDVKPPNVLVSRDGRVMLVDFGLALAVAGDATDRDDAPPADGATGARGVAGTVGYLAPELLRGGKPTPRGDQFAACITVAEILSGRAVAMRDADGRPPTLELVAGLSARARRVLRRGLAEEPSERWPDLGPIIDALSPRRPPFRAAAVVLGVGLVGLVLVESPRPCPLGPPLAAVGEGLAAAPGLNAFVDEWNAARAVVCLEPTAVRVNCLRAQQIVYEQIATALEAPSSIDLALVLPVPEACMRRVAPEYEPGPDVVREATQATLAIKRGDFEAASTLANRMIDQGRRGGDPVRAATGLSFRAELAQHAMGCESVPEQLEEAYFLASGVGAHRRAAKHATQAARAVLQCRTDLAAAEQWLAHADAAMQRFTGDEEVRAMWLHARSFFLATSGRLDEAQRAARQALVIAEDLYGANDVRLIPPLGELAAALEANDDDAAALEPRRRALALAETHLGPDNPMTLGAVGGLAHALVNAGRLEEGERLARRCASSPADVIAHMCTGIEAEARLQGGDAEAAVALFERALQRHVPSDELTAVTHERLAVALERSGRRQDALGHVITAEQLVAPLLPAEHPRLEWLARERARLGG